MKEKKTQQKPSIPDVNLFINSMDNTVFDKVITRTLENGKANIHHYKNVFQNWKSVRIESLNSTNQFGDSTKWLESFLNGFCEQLQDITIRIATGAHMNYNNTPKWEKKYTGGYLQLFRLLDYSNGFLNTLEPVLISLKLNWDSSPLLASQMQSYCIDRINEIKRITEINYFLRKNNPIYFYYDEVIKKFEERINFEETKLRVEHSKNELKAKENPEVTLKIIRDSFSKSDLYKLTESNGGLKINSKGRNYFVFSIGLATIFSMNKITCFDRDQEKEIIIDGSIYIPSFCIGFDKGKDYFQKAFVDNKFQSKETIVSDLHSHYYHLDNEFGRWKDYVTNCPFILSNSIIEKWGYHSGIVNALHELMATNQTLFKNFHKCDEDKSNSNSNKLINPYPLIFKDSKAYQIFDTLHINYKDKPYHTANYSFVYYAMSKNIDKLIICSGVKFINFLAELNINIDRIDSRQYGSKQKELFYNAIKAQF